MVRSFPARAALFDKLRLQAGDTANGALVPFTLPSRPGETSAPWTARFSPHPRLFPDGFQVEARPKRGTAGVLVAEVTAALDKLLGHAGDVSVNLRFSLVRGLPLDAIVTEGPAGGAVGELRSHAELVHVGRLSQREVQQLQAVAAAVMDLQRSIEAGDEEQVLRKADDIGARFGSSAWLRGLDTLRQALSLPRSSGTPRSDNEAHPGKEEKTK